MEITEIYIHIKDSWVGVAVLIAFLIFGLYASIKLRLTKPTTGSEDLIGEIAKVDAEISPEGTIKIMGEIWNVRMDDENTSVKKGDKVEVVGKEGLTLIVKRV